MQNAMKVEVFLWQLFNNNSQAAAILREEAIREARNVAFVKQ
jgi:hypothetical protein